MIAERTDGFWKDALAEGKTYCLRTATNDYFFTPAEYKKLAIDMLSLFSDHQQLRIIPISILIARGGYSFSKVHPVEGTRRGGKQ